MKEGTRVRVRIANPKEWAMGAVEKLNGAVGVITEVKEDYSFTNRPGYLVTFDKPVESWPTPSHGLPHNAFHFGAEDLEVLP